MKYIANLITALRIIAAIAMLFTIPLSVPFFVFYVVGGLSDIIDGTVARRCGSAGDFGAKLDSIADLVFCAAALLRLWKLFPAFVWWAAGTITAVKISVALIGFVRFRKLCLPHTLLNKITGAAVFLLPCVCRCGFFNALCHAVSAVAFLAAAEELLCAICRKSFDAEYKGFLFDIISHGKSRNPE
ncbi:MAG: CDP-alcohol phosphatidyltransferase family protein [Faecousia sp.]